MPWSASWSDVLALGWEVLFNRAGTSGLDFRPSTTLVAAAPPTYDPAVKLWSVPLSDETAPDFGMIVIAVGFGAERCEVPMLVPGGPPPRFRGLAFWETDRFRRPNCGLDPTRRGTAKVVISGGGDGASRISSG